MSVNVKESEISVRRRIVRKNALIGLSRNAGIDGNAISAQFTITSFVFVYFL